jgi:RNA-binding protein 5/10
MVATLLEKFVSIRHVRVIRQHSRHSRSTNQSRGFAFVDFPSVDAARHLMESNTRFSLELDNARLYLEYSRSEEAGGGADLTVPTLPVLGAPPTRQADWFCDSCRVVNFARRFECFQCSAPRSEHADLVPSSEGVLDGSSSHLLLDGRPTTCLVVNGLEPHTPENSLRRAIASIGVKTKDVRVVKSKHTLESRGFAFVDFFSVEDAAKTLGKLNGFPLDCQV